MSRGKKRAVIAAIPSYNMAASLAQLLPEVLKQGYDAIYVLDDHSRDDTAAIVQRFPTVQLISGGKNLGASGNRNRILTVANEWPDAIIHFIDADVRLETPNMPAILREIFARQQNLGIVGGLILNQNGRQEFYNYGPRISLTWLVSGPLLLLHQNAKSARTKVSIQKRFKRILQAWPDTGQAPHPADAHYVAEANMAMTMDTLRAIGGFDTRMRHNEAQDLGNKIAAAGLRCRFDPSFAVTHLSVDVRGFGRYTSLAKTTVQMLHRNKWPLR